MNIDTVTPGRELDALIAEKVMGHTLVQLPSGIYEEVPIPGAGGFVSSELRYYSVSMHAAWKVLEHVSLLRLRKGDETILYKPVIRLEFYEHDGMYSCHIGRCKSVGEDDDFVGRAQDDWECPGQEQAMATAICRAALKAVGA